MIHRIFANRSSFRPIVFSETGLNVILAEKSKTSDENHSRNGLGKSTLVQIINFLLGHSSSAADSLPFDDLKGWVFSMEITIRGTRLTVSRGADNEKRVYIDKVIPGSPITPMNEQLMDIEAGFNYSYDESDWRKVLSWAFFNLAPLDVYENGDARKVIAPEYKNLISHFIRQVFDDPVKTSHTEALSKAELAMTYLLGLDWKFLILVRQLKSREEQADTKQRAALMQLEEWERTREQLEQDCKRIRNDLSHMESGLRQVSISPKAESANLEIAELTQKIHVIENRMTQNRRLLRMARAEQKEASVSIAPVVNAYKRLGLTFKIEALNDLKAIEQFHDRLTKNRLPILQMEITSVEESLLQDDRELKVLDKKRSAFSLAELPADVRDDFVARARRIAELSNEVALKEDCLKRLEEVDAEKTAIEIERRRIVQVAKANHLELESVWSEEDKCFRAIIRVLYGITDASLGVKIQDDSKKLGISYMPKFKSDRSLGKKKLKALALDLTIFQHQPKNGFAIDFMVHDSVLFESSDSRQYAKALKITDGLCKKHHLQYISVMNSDDISNADFTAILPREKFNEYVVHTLSDESPEMTLLGIEF